MKRLHVSIAVEDFDKSVGFYSTLFGTAPTTARPGYAKWFLDDPRVNFVVNAAGADRGVDHLGIQAESPEELAEIASRLKAAEERVFEQANAQCCYHESDKAWSRDPQGLSWETFYTHGEITKRGGDTRMLAVQDAAMMSETATACGAGAAACQPAADTIKPMAEATGAACCEAEAEAKAAMAAPADSAACCGTGCGTQTAAA